MRISTENKAMLAAAGAYSIFGLSYLFSKMALNVAETTVLLLVRFSITFLVLNLLVLAVLPALLEEMIFRVCILGALRKYGDTFAIVVSALLFGFIHGGLSQSVFAVIVPKRTFFALPEVDMPINTSPSLPIACVSCA